MSYRQNWLVPGHNMGIRLQNGYFFFKCVDQEPEQEYLYNRLDTLASGSNNAQIGGSDFPNKPWFEIKGPNNEEPLYDEETSEVLQTFLGVYPAKLRAWYTWPATTPHGGLPDYGAGGSPGADTPGYIEGRMSPIGHPTILGEIPILRKMTVRFAVYNPYQVSVVPALKFKINRMFIKPYDWSSTKDKGIIKRMIAGDIKWRKWSPGFLTIPNYKADEEYNVELVPVTEVEG